LQSIALSFRVRIAGSLIAAVGLAALGLAWLFLADAPAAGLGRNAVQATELLQPFSPQTLVGDLTPTGRRLTNR